MILYVPGADHISVVKSRYENLRKVRERLIDVYHSEFLTTLISKAIDQKDRYRPDPHRPLQKGDIVQLVDKHLKRYYYPMGRVLDIETNSLGEVTSAHILKGSTREKVYRHDTSLILLIPNDCCAGDSIIDNDSHLDSEILNTNKRGKSVRLSAQICKKKLRILSTDDI